MSNMQKQGLRKENITPVVKIVSDDELREVKKLYTSLLLTLKNLSLYPNGHTICINSIEQFYIQLTRFLNKYRTLKLEVERERMIYQGEIISLGGPDEATLHFTLFRDGLRWIEFMSGIEQKEVNDILLIIKKYIKLSAEPEGDIVTAFWEIDFPHFSYEVTEFIWSGEQEIEKFSDLISGTSKSIRQAEPDYREKEYEAEPPIDMLKIILTPVEEAALQEMIRIEENTDLTSYLDVLLDSLLQERGKNSLSRILDALSEEFTLSLMRKDFIVILKILQGLKDVVGISKEEYPKIETLIEEFILDKSSATSLAPLRDAWEQTDPEDAKTLRDIFLLLNSRVIHMLLSLLSQSQPASLKNMLLDVIVQFATQDTHSLEVALKNANVSLLERLVSVIVRMDGNQSLQYLLKLSCHPSGRIRYEAVKGILKSDPGRIREMLTLINDKENSIRQLVLEQMGQARDDVVEEFLISYINKYKSGKVDEKYMIQCFKTLGKCGSSRAVPFLREILLKWGFLLTYRRSVFKRGAAIALLNLGISEADEVLECAARSFFTGIRDIVGKARLEFNDEVNYSVK